MASRTKSGKLFFETKRRCVQHHDPMAQLRERLGNFKVFDRMMIGHDVFQSLPKTSDIPLTSLKLAEEMPFRFVFGGLEDAVVGIVRRPHPQVFVESDERLSQRGDNALGVSESIRQRVLLLPAFRDISEHQHHPGHFALRIADRSGTVVNRSFGAVLGDQQRMVRQSDDHPVPQGPNGRAFDRVAGVFIDDLENGFQRNAFGLLLRPAGQGLGHGIQKRDPAHDCRWS